MKLRVILKEILQVRPGLDDDATILFNGESLLLEVCSLDSVNPSSPPVHNCIVHAAFRQRLQDPLPHGLETSWPLVMHVLDHVTEGVPNNFDEHKWHVVFGGLGQEERHEVVGIVGPDPAFRIVEEVLGVGGDFLGAASICSDDSPLGLGVDIFILQRKDGQN